MRGQPSQATLVDLHNLQQAKVQMSSLAEICSHPNMAFVQGATVVGRTRVKRPLRSQGEIANSIKTCAIDKTKSVISEFSILDWNACFSHEFSKHLGIEETHEPTPARVHVFLRQEGHVHKGPMGFSFPLCG